MALQFMSSSILSGNGVEYHDVPTVGNTSSCKTENFNIPLYEQLQKNEAQKREEHETHRKSLFGARALNEEDAEYLNHLASESNQRENNQKVIEEKLVNDFKRKKLGLDSVIKNTQGKIIVSDKKGRQTVGSKVTMIRKGAKRKSESGSNLVSTVLIQSKIAKKTHGVSNVISTNCCLDYESDSSIEEC